MQSYVASGVNVLAVVNQDMTGYSPNNVIAVYTDYVDTTLTNFVKKLVPVYTDLPLSTDVCGYGCSDQQVSPFILLSARSWLIFRAQRICKLGWLSGCLRM